MGNILEALPFPKKAFTWFSAFLLLVLTYMFYYTIGYPYLKYSYEKQLQPIGVKIDTSILPVKVSLKIPTYVSEFEVQWAYIEIENISEIDLNYPLTFSLKFPKPVNSFNKLFWLETYGESDYFKSAVTFQSMEPKVVSYARIPFLVEKPSNGSKLVNPPDIYINGKEAEVQQDMAALAFKPFKAFLYSFAKFILLPPWSNGVILLLVLFACYFVEESGVWNMCIESQKTKIQAFICKTHRKTTDNQKNSKLVSSYLARIEFCVRVSVTLITAAAMLMLLFFVISLLFGFPEGSNLLLCLFKLAALFSSLWLIVIYVFDIFRVFSFENDQNKIHIEKILPPSEGVNLNRTIQGFTIMGKGLFIGCDWLQDKQTGNDNFSNILQTEKVQVENLDDTGNELDDHLEREDKQIDDQKNADDKKHNDELSKE